MMRGLLAMERVQLRRRGSGRALLLVGVVVLCGYWGRPHHVVGGGVVPSQPPALVAFAPPLALAAAVTDYAMVAAGAIMLLCAALAGTEKAPEQAIEAAPLEKRADYNWVLLMSAFLSFLSGIVNALAILDMSMTVAHHTGNASHTGRLLGENATKFFILMVFYAVGAGVAGFSKSDGETVLAGRFSPGLLGSAIAVAAGCAIRWFGQADTADALIWKDGRAGVTLALWAFSQGLLNAVSSKTVSMPIRTTHMTGYLTDFGSGLGAWIRASVKGEPLPTLRKVYFFGASIFCFGAGGYAAKLSKPFWGAQAGLVPAVLMAIVAMGVPPPEALAAGGQKAA